MNSIQKTGEEAMRRLELVQNKGRPPKRNAQQIWQWFKADIAKEAREREKKIAPRTIKEIQELQKVLAELDNKAHLNESEKANDRAKTARRLAALEQRRHKKKRSDVRIRNIVEGESPTHYWTELNKTKKPRDMILAIRTGTDLVTGEPQYEKDSKRMAEVAKNYHRDLQADESAHTPTERQRKTAELMDNMSAHITDEQADAMDKKVTYLQVEKALKTSKNWSAAGKDGLPYELWKTLHERYTREEKAKNDGGDDDDKPNPLNILELMVAAFNDVEEHGLTKNSKLAEGWMSPIYKKGEKSEISNYRPITILNTDYKLFTKALAVKLASVAPDIINKMQAGFVPGRRITDQTRLTRMVLEYAEATETNGMIVALDQEKAYDKIDHEYLWTTLRNFRLPESFIKTVKSLYQSAKTQVMINGCLSDKFRIQRGVQQGDPLSCLLFDLAIEPLAEALRRSNLEGMQIPGSERRLIATLFADDTTVYMSENDSWTTLMEITESWCIASKAKFNVNKTEILPYGGKEWRTELAETRRCNREGEMIPNGIHIVPDGKMMRSLGAWFGNEATLDEPWGPTMEKIDKDLERWNKNHPTLEGRKLVIQMVIGGRTQYLTQVQGMSTEVQKRLERRVRDFLWDGKAYSPVNTTTMYAPDRRRRQRSPGHPDTKPSYTSNDDQGVLEPR
jgi:hypothetical protein